MADQKAKEEQLLKTFPLPERLFPIRKAMQVRQTESISIQKENKIVPFPLQLESSMTD